MLQTSLLVIYYQPVLSYVATSGAGEAGNRSLIPTIVFPART